MLNNVISFNNSISQIPDDLITISNFAKKYGTSKSYIYKLLYGRKIKRYKFGYLKISEKETIKALNKAG